MIESIAAEQIRGDLASVWVRIYPLVLERLTRIENATAELSKSSPRVETVTTGREEAHKLAGALGTFGLDRGTQLARALERCLSDPRRSQDVAEAEHLVANLRATIERARVGQPGTATHR